jgi:hypothetical protein
MPPSEFVLEEDDIYFVSEIHIERYEAARRWDEIKSNHINTAAIEPHPHAIHDTAERITTSAFNPCAKCRRSAHAALLVACSAGAHGSLSRPLALFESVADPQSLKVGVRFVKVFSTEPYDIGFVSRSWMIPARYAGRPHDFSRTPHRL